MPGPRPAYSPPGATQNRPFISPSSPTVPAPIIARPGGGHGHHDHGHDHHHRHRDRHRHGHNPIYIYPSPIYSTYPFASYYTNPYYYVDPGVLQIQTQNELLRQQIEQLRQENAQLQQGPLPPNANNRLADRNKVRYQQAMETGARLFEMGTYSRAADKFEEASRYIPNDATAHFFRGQALFASGQFDDAVRAIKTGLQINPNWLGVDFDMRNLYKDPADLTRQLARLGARLQANPLDRDALFLLGFELFSTGEKTKARAVLEQAGRLEPDAAHLKPFLDFYKANP